MIINRQPFDYALFCQQMEIRMPCHHARAIPHRKFKAPSLQPYYKLQCPECGASLSSQLKYTIVQGYRDAGHEIPDWNGDLHATWVTQRSAAREAIRKSFAWDHAGWWDRYEKYLFSNEWRIIRERILRRDDHVCRECHHRPATQVHHLTYERAGHESDDDLIAICRPCHQQIHPHHAGLEQKALLS